MKEDDKDDNDEEKGYNDEKGNDDDEKGDDDNDKDKDGNEKNNDRKDAMQGALKNESKNTKKVDIKQGEKDYKKWMNQLKIIKSSHGKEGITEMDKQLTKMIQEYKIILAQQGYDYDADAVPANQEVVNVEDSDDDKEYINLETVGN